MTQNTKDFSGAATQGQAAAKLGHVYKVTDAAAVNETLLDQPMYGDLKNGDLVLALEKSEEGLVYTVVEKCGPRNESLKINNYFKFTTSAVVGPDEMELTVWDLMTLLNDKEPQQLDQYALVEGDAEFLDTGSIFVVDNPDIANGLIVDSAMKGKLKKGDLVFGTSAIDKDGFGNLVFEYAVLKNNALGWQIQPYSHFIRTDNSAANMGKHLASVKGEEYLKLIAGEFTHHKDHGRPFAFGQELIKSITLPEPVVTK